MTEELTARQKFIVSSLLETRSLGFREILKQTDVSERTIFREISSINSALEENHVKISIKNSELTLSGGERAVALLKQSLGAVPKRWLLTSEQRTLFITAQLLLADEPYKSNFFSYQLNVVESTVSLYMDKIGQWLKEKNLSLSRKRRYGIRVEGSEWNKRNALVALIYEYKPVEELLPYVYGTKDDPLIRVFFNILFGDRTLGIASDVLRTLSGGAASDDVSYLTSLLHVMISIKKTMEGHPILLPPDFLQDALSADARAYGARLREFLSRRGIPITDSEIVYIYVHSPGNYIYSADKKFRELGIPLDRLAEELVYEVQKGLGLRFGGDGQLVSGLSNYLNLVLYRISMGIQMKNSLLEQVRSYYGRLFGAVEIACKRVFSKYNIQLSKDEVGFITMQIGSVLERTERPVSSLSVLILCPNGVFASRILLDRLQGILRDTDRVEVKSLHDWSESSGGPYDLILSTADIGAGRGGLADNFLVVSPFLNGADVSRIGECVRNLRERAGPPGGFSLAAEGRHAAEEEDGDVIRRMAETSLLQTLRADSFESLVQSLAAGLYDRQVAADRAVVAELILRRQRIGSVVVPNTRVSLLHTRSDSVREPFIGVYRLEGELTMESPGFVREPVDTFLVLLAREHERPAVLEKMGDISIALIEDREFPPLLRSGSAGELRRKFERLLNPEGGTTKETET